MSQSGQQGEPSGRAGAARGHGAKSEKSGKSGKAKGNKSDNKSKDKRSAAKSTGTGKGDGPERPGASGHRFGPDLACSECGILWDLHQREPKPCKTEAAGDAFARRPAVGFDGTAGAASKSEGAAGQAAATSTEPQGSSDSATESSNND